MRRTRLVAALSATIGLGLAVSACGSGAATSEARSACNRIEHSLTLYRQSLTATSPAKAQALATQAQGALLAALPFASAATSNDGSFNALMTTLSEATRVPEKYLVDSLSLQCHVIDSNTPYLAT